MLLLPFLRKSGYVRIRTLCQASVGAWVFNQLSKWGIQPGNGPDEPQANGYNLLPYKGLHRGYLSSAPRGGVCLVLGREARWPTTSCFASPPPPCCRAKGAAAARTPGVFGGPLPTPALHRHAVQLWGPELREPQFSPKEGAQGVFFGLPPPSLPPRLRYAMSVLSLFKTPHKLCK